MAGTIEINGTGGIIEGNLGAANVNVNLDPIYGNFNGSTSSSLSNDNDFDTIWATNGGFVSAWIFPKSVGETAGRIFDKDKWALTMSDAANVLEFSVVHGTTTGVWKTGAVVPFNAWTHVGVYYDSDSTSHDPVIYINGIATTIAHETTPEGSLTSDASDTLHIGNRADGARTFDGYIMDVKIYRNVAISATHAAKMASKINVDKSAPDMPSGIRLWWKGTASTGTDSSGEGNNLTASNLGSVVYDAFSVDVYDGYDGSDAATRTQTDGTFTVTKGKVEGTCLTSVSFDGTGDVVKSSSSHDIMNDKDATIAFWYKGNAPGTAKTILQAIDHNHALIYSRNGNEMRLYSTTGATNEFGLDATQVTASGLYDGNWHHMVWVLDHGGQSHVIYVDGVSYPVTFLTANNHTVDWNGVSIGGAYGDLTGSMKDVKFYDYHLSADQAASLYSNTYPQTPLWWWKLDEGSGNASGSGTAQTGGAVDLTVTNATWVNGTLDLDGAFTIGANGFLSAPRGTLEVAGNFENDATLINNEIGHSFEHNDGTVLLNGANSTLRPNNNSTSGTGTHFYNLTGGDAGYVDGYEVYTVENKLTTDDSLSWYMNGNNTIYIGKAGVRAGEFEINGPMNFTTHGRCYIEGAGGPTLPALIDYNGSHSGASGATGADTAYVHLTNTNWVGALTMGSTNFKLLGDAEFDAVTVSSGAELDLNGQRAEFSGLLSSSGTIACGTNALVVADSVDTTSATTGNMNLIETGDGHTHKLTSSTITTWMLNGGTITNSAHGHMADNIIVGAGKFDVGHNVASGTPLVNVTTATGAELDGNTFEIPLSGDFTTSGGLIGKSAVDFDSVDDSIDCGSDASIDDIWTGGGTVEAWIKADSDGENSRGVIAGKVYWFINLSGETGGKSKLSFTKHFSGDDPKWTTVNTHISNSKWHHIAVTYNSGAGANDPKFYIDGKQVAIVQDVEAGSDSMSSDAGSNLFLGNYSADGSSTFDGHIGKVSLWSHELSVSELRAQMFYDFIALNADNTVFPDSSRVDGTGALIGDLEAWYQFDTGTGATLYDSTSNDNDGTIDDGSNGSGAAWAGAGNFDKGSSTLVMAKSGTQNIYYKHVEAVNNLTINDGSTTQLWNTEAAGNGLLDIEGNLTVNEKLKSHADKAQSRIRFTTAGTTIAVGSDVKTTALSELYSMELEHSGSTNIPELTTPRLFLDSTATAVATGDLTLTSELQVNSGTTFNANGNTIHSKYTNVVAGTLNLSNSSMVFDVSNSGDAFALGASCTLTTGNTTITGYSTSAHTHFTAPDEGGYEVVGDVKWMLMRGSAGGAESYDSDLTVVGSVIDCSFESSHANIRQWHHTLDTQQLLDADEAGDDDLRLTKPALDNALELMTK